MARGVHFDVRMSGMEPARKIPPRRARPVTLTAMSEVEGTVGSEMLRDAALRLDRTRRDFRKTDTERALLVWEGLVRGRVTLVDWFDADGRRFILLKLNTSKAGRACGLTAREQQVAMSAALGESSKIISYRLGLSTSRVSVLLNGVMRKLGVRSKAQLVMMVRVLESHQNMGFRPSIESLYNE